jgi:PilZ domain
VSERRANPRVRGPFEGFWDGAGRQDGRIVDLSVSGCFIESIALPKVGQIVTVSIAISGGQINLPAEVVYAQATHGFAVRFVETPVEVANVLRKEIANKLPR